MQHNKIREDKSVAGSHTLSIQVIGNALVTLELTKNEVQEGALEVLSTSRVPLSLDSFRLVHKRVGNIFLPCLHYRTRP